MARPLTITASGNAQIDTAEKKFGTSSGYFDGNGDYITITQDGTEFSLDDGQAWSIEFFLKLDAGYTLPATLICSNQDDNFKWRLDLEDAGGGNLQLSFYTTRSEEEYPPGGSIGASTTTTSNITLGNFSHIVVATNGQSTISIWVDGTRKVQNGSVSFPDLPSSDDPITIGALKNNTSYSQYLKGWIDELRVRKGRPTGEYDTSDTTITVPTQRFVDDANTLVLMHFEGTDGSTTFIDTVNLTLSGAASLTGSASLSAIYNPNPSIVYLGNDVYTWDNTDTWTSIYDSDDRWLVWEKLSSSAALTVKAGISNVRGTADLIAQTNVEISARLSNVRGQASLEIIADQTAEARLSDVRGTASLTDNFALSVEARLSDVRGSAELTSQTDITITADNFNKASFSAEIVTELTVEARLSNVRGASELSAQFDTTITARLSGIRGSADLASSFDLSATAENFNIASFETAFIADLSVDADIIADGRASLESTAIFYAKGGLLIQVDEPYDYTWDTVPEDIWNGFPADRWDPRGWFAFDNISLEVSTGRLLSSEARLDTEFNLEISAQRAKNASADLSAQADLEVKGNYLLKGQSNLEVNADLSSRSSIDRFGTASFDNQTNLDVSGRILKLATFDTIVFGDLTVSAVVEYSASADLEVSADLTAKGGYRLSAQTDLTAVATITPQADILKGTGGDLEAAFDQQVSAGVTRRGRAELDAFASTITAAARLPGGDIDIEMQFGLTAGAVMTYGGRSELEAFISQISAGRQANVRGSAQIEASFAADFAGDLKLLDSQFVFKVLSETRRLDLESETRIFDVLAENRTFDLESETRTHRILQENRTVEVGYLMQ